MSKEETIFVKTLWGIVASVAGTMIVGLFLFYSMVVKFEAATAEKIIAIEQRQALNNLAIKEMHNKDVNNLKEGVWDIKVNQRDMLNTQKEILKILKK